MAPTSSSPLKKQSAIILAAMLTAGATSLMFAPASQAAPLAGETTAPVAQKGPAPGAQQPDQVGDPFATVPGGSSGGLVYANIEDLRVLVAEIGSARLERGSNGDQFIAANVDGINYAVDVYGCDPDCADLTLTASFEMDGVSVDMMNEWNTTRRFGKAYIREDGDAVLQFAINTRYGITVETFRDDLIWWEEVLGDYVEFIGFR